MYDGLNATGNALSTATTQVMITAGQANTIPVTLNGIVYSIVLTLAYPTPPQGIATTIPLAVTAKDADGNIIENPGGYYNAITLSDSDSTYTSVSPTMVFDPSTAVVVSYNGGPLQSATFSASAPGVSSQNVTNAVLTPAGTGCNAARSRRTRVASLPRPVEPHPIGPGPAAPVCPHVPSGFARCLAWIRTDLAHMDPRIGPSGYGPSQLQTAYNLTSASAANGAGVTVVIVDAFDDPHAEADLGVYRSTFGLPACTSANGCFKKVGQDGTNAHLPAPDTTGGWEAEESLDMDMVSAICPNCNIVLMEATSNISTDFYTAEDTAAGTCAAGIISNSWGINEYNTESADEFHFNHPGVMMTFSSGDAGYGVGYPATSQYVTAVGGTSLTHSGGTWSETAWNGTGSGCSQFIAQPAWQTSLGSSYTNLCHKRIDNDVAAVADPNTGVAMYDSYGGTGQNSCSAWCVFGGTSVSAPVIAGVYAIAGNGGTLTYGSYSYTHTGSLTDVTSGSNGNSSHPCTGGSYLCTAKAGYDGPTGNGSPIGTGAF